MSDLTALAPRRMPPGTDPAACVAAITAASRTSFAAGMAILPKPRRQAMWAIYAFARVVDDIADGPWSPAEKIALLSDWRAEILALYEERPVSAIGRALLGPVAAYQLPRAEFLGLIDGMEMDAGPPIVAPPMARLRQYTRRVAGTVGILSMHAFGAWVGEPSQRFALALADALQLTNILRDVAEDAGIGRLYLPAEALAEAGIAADPQAVARDPRLPQVLARLAPLARAEFATAHALVPQHSRTALAPALMMMGAYRATLDRLEARQFAPGARLGKFAKLAHGLACVAAPGWGVRA